MIHAGHLFICACCKQPTDEHGAVFDNELDEPVCGDCDFNLKHAKAALIKFAKLKRCVTEEDIKSGAIHYKRFQPPQ